MANFKPFNNYTFYLLDKLIRKYNISDPFLDIGCGVGELSYFLAKKGWEGTAIDGTDSVVEIASDKLKKFPYIKVKCELLSVKKNKFNSAFLWDVIEHIKEDDAFLKKVNKSLIINGYLVLSVPSNPREWRWDDEFYGHYRRYDEYSMSNLLKKTGFEPIIFWESSYPVFWAMRRIYTNFRSSSSNYDDKQAQTMLSSSQFAWNGGFLSRFLNKFTFIWMPIYMIQYLFFKSYPNLGFQMVVVAKKLKTLS